ncbi:MAG: MerR family transcriptional regulator [Candidatus Omnitrophica bacterium]|nr:MerR family transcriptional regulator [Candidatus Omnitrophota bacterium]
MEIARLVGISPERLYYWERMGIVAPKHVRHGIRIFREYSRDDMKRALYVKNLVDTEGYRLERAIDKLQEYLLLGDGDV